MTERWLVTGALGCIGSWVVRVLLDEGADVTTLDVDVTGHRLRALVSEEELREVRRIRGDITSLDAVRDAFAQSGATHVVHLAALQIPFVRADPSRGMAVNVVGTVNMFEAAAATEGRVQGLVYASSAAAYDAIEDVAAGTHGDLPGHPSTLYGVTKRANEGTAQVYWQERSVPSIGIRPQLSTIDTPGDGRGRGEAHGPLEDVPDDAAVRTRRRRRVSPARSRPCPRRPPRPRRPGGRTRPGRPARGCRAARRRRPARDR